MKVIKLSFKAFLVDRTVKCTFYVAYFFYKKNGNK